MTNTPSRSGYSYREMLECFESLPYPLKEIIISTIQNRADQILNATKYAEYASRGCVHPQNYVIDTSSLGDPQKSFLCRLCDFVWHTDWTSQKASK